MIKVTPIPCMTPAEGTLSLVFPQLKVCEACQRYSQLLHQHIMNRALLPWSIPESNH